MTNLIIAGALIFIFAIAMTMVGKGGGNFYIIILTFAGLSMHEAATTGQFILFSASVAAMIVFNKNKSISWILAIIIGSVAALSALGGGYFSHLFNNFTLKIIFAVMLVIAGILMMIPVSQNQVVSQKSKIGYIRIKSGSEIYRVNLWIALPTTLLTGFGSGMVGVSGGSFLVPLMVLACSVPMVVAVGTASALIALTALVGFAGHALQGDFNPSWAIPLAIVTIIGGLLGGKFALKTKPKNLKKIFAYTNWLAALFMLVNALHSAEII